MAFSQYINAASYLSPQSSQQNSSSTSPLFSSNQNSNSKSQAIAIKSSKEESAAEEDEENEGKFEKEDELSHENRLSISCLVSKPFDSQRPSDMTKANSQVNVKRSLNECEANKRESQSPSITSEDSSPSNSARKCGLSPVSTSSSAGITC